MSKRITRIRRTRHRTSRKTNIRKRSIRRKTAKRKIQRKHRKFKASYQREESYPGATQKQVEKLKAVEESGINEWIQKRIPTIKIKGEITKHQLYQLFKEYQGSCGIIREDSLSTQIPAVGHRRKLVAFIQYLIDEENFQTNCMNKAYIRTTYDTEKRLKIEKDTQLMYRQAEERHRLAEERHRLAEERHRLAKIKKDTQLMEEQAKERRKKTRERTKAQEKPPSSWYRWKGGGSEPSSLRTRRPGIVTIDES